MREYEIINLKIEYPNGNFNQCVRTDMKVEELIRIIEERRDTYPLNAKLYYGLIRLEDDKCLYSYNIKNDDTLQFVY